MKILVTGAYGFIGKNLIAEIKNRFNHEIYEYDRNTEFILLDEYCKDADFVFHLAGVNRPKVHSDFMDVNFGFTKELLNTLKKHNNNCPVMISSSTQAELDNQYGKSKKASENLVIEYGEKVDSRVLVYRFPNIFGKWSKPNYNSVIATFCYNISRGLPIQIDDSNVVMNLVYIDDVVNELLNALEGRENKNGKFCEISKVYNVKLVEIADLISRFKRSREEISVPNMADEFTKKLYSTYLSYLPKDQFSYDLKMNEDSRGSFTEFIRTPDRGQISVNITKPGITKGNHWHNSKVEKFLVVSGKGIIRFRRIDTKEVLEYFVSSDKMEVIDIPTGYTHNIENNGYIDMVTIMWANESFDTENPDTYYLEV